MMIGLAATPIVVVILCVVVLILAFAVVEQFHQLDQIRVFLDLQDRPSAIDLGSSKGMKPSEVGLPAALDGLDRGLVLFLSNRCGTCRTIAANLSGGAIPVNLTLVVESPEDDSPWIVDEFALGLERVVVDDDNRISGSLGINISPSGVRIESGRLVSASTIPTVRQLYVALPTVYENS
jgi:hypothetical protein